MLAASGLATAASPAAAQSDTPAASEADAGNITEITVTAQRRSERLQDVPVSVRVQTGAALEAAGIRDLEDLTFVTPGLLVGAVGPNVQPAVRGVSTQEANPGNDANIAVYLDGVYQASQFSNQFELPDIDRIEVLKGPQGTVFGRNATGGAIQIFTKSPSFDPTGQFSVSYGSFNDVDARGFVSLPVISDVVAASVSAWYGESDGYYHDTIRGGRGFGKHGGGARGKLLFEPSGSFDGLLTVSFSDRFDATANAGTAANGNSFGTLFPDAKPTSTPRYVSTNLANAGASVRSINASLKLNWDVGEGAITSTSAIARDRNRNVIEGDYTNADALQYDITYRGKSESQEFLYTSPKGDRLNFVAGTFLYHNVSSNDPVNITGSLGGAAIYGTQEAWAASVFADGTLDITDRFALTAGGRYSYEKRTGKVAFSAIGAPAPALNKIGEDSFRNFSPRVALKYKIDNQTNVYASFSQGFKSGGFAVIDVTDPFKPEKLTAFEVGLKASRGPMSGSLAAYYYDYKNLQVQVSRGTTGVTGNAKGARNYGFEGDLTVRATSELTLTAAFSALNAQFTDYPDAIGNLPVLNADGTPCHCGNTAIVFDADGKTLARAPRFTGSFSALYTKQLGIGEFTVSGNLFRSSRVYFEQLNRQDVSQAPYWMLNGRIALTLHNGLQVFAYGDNLLNDTVITATFLNSQADGLSYNKPRNIGGGMRYSF